jgi:DNA-binding GntR family transcriptional regulator
LAPGERITQDKVADLLGVSRQPVSHALQLLKRRGLVIEHGRRGLQIAPLDARRLRDLYQVREALDGVAAENAARRAQSGVLSKVERGQAAQVLRAGCALSADAAMSAWIAADVAFHSMLYRLSGNQAISETVAEQWPHFMRSMRLVLATDAARTRVWSEHGAILAAVLAGKADAAGRLARSHAATAGDDTARSFESGQSVA